VEENVRSPMKPSKCVHYLGRIDDGMDVENKKEVIGWVNEGVLVWERAPWLHNGDTWNQVGTHLTFLITIDRYLYCVWERARKLGSMLE
jgi:hypothetical protein